MLRSHARTHAVSRNRCVNVSPATATEEGDLLAILVVLGMLARTGMGANSEADSLFVWESKHVFIFHAINNEASEPTFL